MQPTGTDLRCKGARLMLLAARDRGVLSAFLLVFLLMEGLPCATLLGCRCPSLSGDGSNGSKLVAPADCCKASTDPRLIISVPVESRSPEPAPAILLAVLPDSPAIPLLPEMLLLSPLAAKPHAPPPLFLLLCTLLN
jgi:hypothetical protein